MNLYLQAYCLICHDRLQPDTSWKAIFSAEKEILICPTCENKFEKITGEKCRICSRLFRDLDERFRFDDLCHDCVRWEEDLEWQGYLDSNHSLFLYNDFFKEVMAKYKFRGDYVLAKLFAERIADSLRLLNPDLLVPIPLSCKRLYERGFNQAEALILEAGLSPANLLTRKHLEKQSKKSRTERIHIPQVFQVNRQLEIKGTEIILIDDIYTTGSTLRHAAKLLKEEGAKRIRSLTLAR
ncbi:ComF family protein [Bacillus sp. OK048]|uniref:ComF family protein n=1 Tax=Bacillus sp. OK048 TaxID=1882761 RepID=UPI00088A6E31|nr:ComF family protein [Bacillus sp. OK048]SDM70621.1 competence protein ComFC [Bacillus sp. OK048]